MMELCILLNQGCAACSPASQRFSGGEVNPACQDPTVAAFSNDVNAQTPQSSNGNLPACPEPPSPPPPSPGNPLMLSSGSHAYI